MYISSGLENGFFHGIVQRTLKEHGVTMSVAFAESFGKVNSCHGFILQSFRHCKDNESK